MLEFWGTAFIWIFMILIVISMISVGKLFDLKKDGKDTKKIAKILYISLIMSVLFLIIGMHIQNIANEHELDKKEVREKQEKIIKKYKANNFKMLNEDDTNLDYDSDNNGYSLDSNNQGEATYKFLSNNGSYIKILKGNGAQVKRINKTRINVDMYVSENKDREKVTAGVYNKNGKLLKKMYLEIANQRDSYVNKEVKDDKTTKSASEIKKDNEKKNLASYKQDLNTIPDKTKGVISKAYVDENGSEQTTVVLSDEALNVSNSELKNISHKIYNYMSNFISNHTPFPDDSQASSIRIIDSSGNLIAKTSWGDFKYVGE
ncbi:hypothetical protein [Apilactobacillus xinyiensis]|uniref:hypothetical protein n=1 Tax=Apilactobacillus xinyiensis TaxID=2841032 RepID=UPI00200D5BE1|nr:hypothetical protein [Apilactobacillus xinyiensis]MCL0330560.1 hypothetical protein [Apilactobacillus xinyiensis]